jgi:hypothetical protein
MVYQTRPTMPRTMTTMMFPSILRNLQNRKTLRWFIYLHMLLSVLAGDAVAP